jgi:hypothetical protein
MKHVKIFEEYTRLNEEWVDAWESTQEGKLLLLM